MSVRIEAQITLESMPEITKGLGPQQALAAIERAIFDVLEDRGWDVREVEAAVFQ